MPLMLCEEKVGPLVQPDFGVELPNELSPMFKSYSEVNLKRIPFEAFESIIFGYSMSELDKSTITELVRKNENLSHIKLRIAKHNIYGNIEINDLVV